MSDTNSHEVKHRLDVTTTGPGRQMERHEWSNGVATASMSVPTGPGWVTRDRVALDVSCRGLGTIVADATAGRAQIIASCREHAASLLAVAAALEGGA